MPQELERCGAAGVKAAIILSSGFAEEKGETGPALQKEVEAIAKKYDMAVSGPNGEGFANTAAALCPTFSPAMDPGDVPLLPRADRTRGQVAVISQSGGMGFAFSITAGRRSVVPLHRHNGNEACLSASDFAEFIIDEGKTDAILMLIEDIKEPRPRACRGESLACRKPLIVNASARRKQARARLRRIPPRVATMPNTARCLRNTAWSRATTSTRWSISRRHS